MISQARFPIPAAYRSIIDVASGHAVRQDNPHSVTAGQIGTRTIGEVDRILADAVIPYVSPNFFEDAGRYDPIPNIPVSDKVSQALFVNRTPPSTGLIFDESVKRNHSQAVGSPMSTWDGTAYLSVPSLTGSETVVSKKGTANVTFAAGRINFTSGTCYDLILSNGSHYPMSEGAGPLLHDTSASNRVGTVISQPVGFWSTKQDLYHYSLAHGYSRRMNSFKNASSPTATWTRQNIQVLTSQPDPFGGNFAIRLIPLSATFLLTRIFGASFVNEAIVGHYFKAYVRKVSTGNNNVFYYSFGGGTTAYIDLNTLSLISGNPVHSITNFGDGWIEVITQIGSLGNTTPQLSTCVFNNISYTPVNTTSGLDVFCGIVETPETAIYPNKTTSAIASHEVPSHVSGSDASGMPLLRPSGPWHNLCGTLLNNVNGVNGFNAGAQPVVPTYSRRFGGAARTIVSYSGLSASELALVESYYGV